jgi:hypothetical protein
LHSIPHPLIGNDVLIPGKGTFKTGHLYVDIAEVTTGPFNVTERGLEVTVYMSPSEALEVLYLLLILPD